MLEAMLTDRGARRYAAAFAAVAAAMIVPAVKAAAPVVIWPIDPVVEAGRGGSLIWLENRGREPALLQIRVYRWTQANGENAYEAQREVSVSPPIVEVAAGKRQAIRLTADQNARAAGESAYRVAIDEIPRQTEASAQGETAATGGSIRFQMRYSIPLFVYGAGGPAKPREAQPDLRCALSEASGQRSLNLTNVGPVNARLVGVSLAADRGRVNLGEGLLGYVLPGATFTRALPPGVTGREPLSMQGRRGETIQIARCSEE
jgi:fimbrial chaperone protein